MSLLFSNAYGDEILDAFFGGGTWTAPTNWELSLWNGNPFTGGSAEISTAGGYGRITIPNSALTFDDTPASGGGYAVSSLIDVNFPSSGVAAADWQSASYLGFSRVAAAAPVLAMRTPEVVTVLTGDNWTFPAGSLRMEFSSEEFPSLVQEAWTVALLKKMLGGSAAGGPATWYFGLWLGNPYSGGAEVTTVGTGYARLAVTNNGAAWNTATVSGKRAVSLAGALRWPASGLATAAFGQVLYIGLCDGPSSAPKLARPLPGAGRAVGVGSFLSVPADGLVITLSSSEG